MIVYQIVYEERDLDGKWITERCECYKNERDAASVCFKCNKNNKGSDIRWFYEPIDVYEKFEETNFDSLLVKWNANFINGKIDSVGRMGFIVDATDNWELNEDSNDVNNRYVALSICVEEGDEENIVKIAKKAYAEYMESNK